MNVNEKELYTKLRVLSDSLVRKTVAYGFSRPTFSGITGLLLFLVVVYAVCLNAHKTLYANVIGQDVIIFLDGITRVAFGHVPHLDFASGLGLLNFYGATFFLPFLDNVYLAFLAYYTVVIVYLLLVAAYLSFTRLPRLIAILLLFYVAALVGSPAELGAANNSVSHAMFYNHYGWAALLLCFLFLLKPRHTHKSIPILDVLLVSSLLLFVIYTKATYAIVIVGLYLLALILYRQRFIAMAISVAAIVVVVMAAIEITFPGLHQAYVHDLEQMKNVNTGVSLDFLSPLRINLVYVVECMLAIYLARHIYLDNSSYSMYRHLCVIAYLMLASFFVFENNAQITGLPSLLGVVIALAAFYALDKTDKDIERLYRSFGLLLLVFLFVYPELSEKNSAIARYFRDTRSAQYAFPVPEKMQGLYLVEGDAKHLQALIAANGYVDVETYRSWQLARHPRQEIYQSEYAYSIAQGVFEFEKVLAMHGEGAVVNFDFSNPFSAIMGIEPAKGEFLWYHVNRNISSRYHPHAEQVFSHARYVAVPQYPAWDESKKLMLELYGDYLRQYYIEVSSSPLWKFYMRNSRADI